MVLFLLWLIFLGLSLALARRVADALGGTAGSCEIFAPVPEAERLGMGSRKFMGCREEGRMLLRPLERSVRRLARILVFRQGLAMFLSIGVRSFLGHASLAGMTDGTGFLFAGMAAGAFLGHLHKCAKLLEFRDLRNWWIALQLGDPTTMASFSPSASSLYREQFQDGVSREADILSAMMGWLRLRCERLEGDLQRLQDMLPIIEILGIGLPCLLLMLPCLGFAH